MILPFFDIKTARVFTVPCWMINARLTVYFSQQNILSNLLLFKHFALSYKQLTEHTVTNIN